MAAVQVRGRGSCKFSSAFGGSGLLSWTTDDPESKPSKEAFDPSRGCEPGPQGLPEPLPPPPPRPPSERPPSRAWDGSRAPDCSRGRRGTSARRRRRSEEAPRLQAQRSRRRNSRSRRRRSSRSAARRPRQAATNWVRVVNVPSVVQSQHLQHLFKTSLGKVSSCSVDDGIALVCFERAEHAAKAVEKYDGGEINGCTISVKLEFSAKRGEQEHERRAGGRATSRDKGRH
mmetsp:Transcript_87675/g.283863  ORF Transcript_87675/g.283863 Transcript_87675/m.283863 type:complete len:230 (+) Transcript_87675:73-762(+)